MVTANESPWRRRVLALFILVVLVLSGCTSAPSGSAPTTSEQPSETASSSGPERGGVLRIMEPAPAGPIGTPWEISGNSICAVIPAFEPLLMMDGGGKLFPKLAEKWTVSDDKLTITLNLRKGVKFHDGTDFNAEAVRYNLQHQMDAKRFAVLKSLEVVDDHTIKLNLNEWDNRVFVTLAGTTSVMASPTSIEKNGQEKARVTPVGTGPFEFVSYDRDVRIVLKKFAGYWDEGKPYLDGVEINFIMDPQTQKVAMLAGQIDVWSGPNGEMQNELKNSGTEFEYIMNANGITMMWPDSANPDSPLSNVKVREAISWAIDREAIVRVRGFGVLAPHNQPAFPGTMAYNADYKGPSFDPAKAKQLLAEAGYPNGLKLTLYPADFLDKDTVMMIQKFLGDVGIDAQVQFNDAAKYRELNMKGWKNGFLIQPWGKFANYNSLMGFYFWGSSAYASTERPAGFEEKWDISRQTTEEELAKVKELNKIITVAHTVIPLTASQKTYVTTKKVHDTKHMQWVTWPWWTPAEAWLSK